MEGEDVHCKSVVIISAYSCIHYSFEASWHNQRPKVILNFHNIHRYIDLKLEFEEYKDRMATKERIIKNTGFLKEIKAQELQNKVMVNLLITI